MEKKRKEEVKFQLEMYFETKGKSLTTLDFKTLKKEASKCGVNIKNYIHKQNVIQKTEAK